MLKNSRRIMDKRLTFLNSVLLAAKLVCFVLIQLLLTNRSWAALPPGWTDTDIGSPGMVGSAAYNNGNWTVAGGGTDIWGTADQFHFASTTMNGDGTVIAKVTTIQNTDPWAKAGVMIRNDNTAGAANASIVATFGQGVSYQWRATAGGMSSFTAVAGISNAVWV